MKCKNCVTKLSILGGIAALVYFAARKKSSDAVRQSTPLPLSPLPPLPDASQLEGYFSTGALAADEYRTSYDHGHDHTVPCCSG